MSTRTGTIDQRPTYSPGRVGGFTLLGLLLIVALMGVGLLAVGEVWHFAMKREKEQELLFIGGQFKQAIKSYHARTPVASKAQPYPFKLEDLLKDPRFPSTVRHLRKIYIDPISGKAEWGLLTNPNGGIYGVYSLSEEAPIKLANFRSSDIGLADKTRYADWKFIFIGASSVASATPGTTPSSNSLTVRRLQ
jgi:type II secretory pathway pseudopilin PulG